MIDYSKNDSLTEQATALLNDYYTLEGENIQDAFLRASKAYSGGDDALASRLYGYASNHWFMFSSPLLANAPVPGARHKGMPISCFLTYVPDTLLGLIDHQTELAWLSVKGGGVGGHWSDVRAVSDKAPSPIPFMKVADSAMTAYKQGRTRKGSYAAYYRLATQILLNFSIFDSLLVAILIVSASTSIMPLTFLMNSLMQFMMMLIGICLTPTTRQSGKP